MGYGVCEGSESGQLHSSFGQFGRNRDCQGNMFLEQGRIKYVLQLKGQDPCEEGIKNKSKGSMYGSRFLKEVDKEKIRSTSEGGLTLEA